MDGILTIRITDSDRGISTHRRRVQMSALLSNCYKMQSHLRILSLIVTDLRPLLLLAGGDVINTRSVWPKMPVIMVPYAQSRDAQNLYTNAVENIQRSITEIHTHIRGDKKGRAEAMETVESKSLTDVLRIPNH